MATITATGDDGAADFTISQDAAACTLNLNPSSSGPFAAAGGSSSFAVETLVGCNWSAVASDPAVMITSAAAGTGSGTIDFTVGANPTALARNFAVSVTVSNNGLMADHTISQAGATCTIALDPASSMFGAPGGPGGFNVLSLPGCDWTATPSDAAVMITGGATGSGSGAVTFNLGANPAGTPRSLGITVEVTGGSPSATHTIDQGALVCAPSATPPSASFGPGGGSGSFMLGADGACSWTATASDAAVTITSAAAGTGNATIDYTVAADLSGVANSFTIDVSFPATGESVSHTISQNSLVCATTPVPPSASFGPAGGSGGFTFDTDPLCAWTAAASDAAVTITAGASGSGDGSVSYDVAADLSGAAGSFTIDVSFTATGETASHTIEREALVCSPVVQPTSQSVPASGVSGASFAVQNAQASCSWTATPSDPAVTITGGAAGTGDRTVDFDVAANPVPTPRSFTIEIAVAATGESATFSIEQDALFCSATLTPVSATIPAAGGSGSFELETESPCAWTATASDAAVTITSAASGTGNATIAYDVGPTPNVARTFFIDVAFTGTGGGARHTINQRAAVCTFTLGSTGASYPEAGGGSSVSVTASRPDCAWTAASDASWLLVGAAGGTGDGSVAYTVLASNWAIPRTGRLTIAGRTFTVNQEAGTCTFAIAPTSAGFGLFAGSTVVTVDTGVACLWTADSNDDWVSIDLVDNGNGPGTVIVGVDRNETGSRRTGTATIAEQTLTMVQSSNDGGAFALSPLTVGFPGAGGHGQLQVQAPSAIDWEPVPDVDWISIIAPLEGIGAGIVQYLVAPNPSPVARSGHINVGGQLLNVMQAPAGASTIQVWIGDEAPAQEAAPDGAPPQTAEPTGAAATKSPHSRPGPGGGS
jgi:hypothetical protein